MSRSGKQILVLVAGVLVLFAVVSALMLRVMPGPHNPADYMVVGSLAALVSLVLLFAVLFGISSSTFTKRR